MYFYFDTHCDTLIKLYRSKTTLFDSNLRVNYSAFEKYAGMVQCFALYNDGSLKMQDFYDAALLLKNECERYGKMHLCTCTADIDKALSLGKTAAILTCEALGNTKDFAAKHLYILKKYGYMMVGLVWNFDNPLCGGAMGEDRGLTVMGECTLKIMEQLSIIPDVSHMNEKSFDDVMNIFCKPIVASHSNSAFVHHHKRNLSDNNIKKIIKNGGIIGLNVYPDFVGGKNTADDIIAHSNHIISLGGETNICIGADLDCIDTAVSGIENAGDIQKLFDVFARHNYPKKLIKDISFNNIYNIFKKYEI